MLPVDDNIDTEGYIFMGHIFYENTMVMNFLRGLVMSQTSRKRFFEVVSAAKDWFAVRQSGEMSWEVRMSMRSSCSAVRSGSARKKS